MATTDSNFFEIQRRGSTWFPYSTLDDEVTAMGWDADPNSAISGNTPGETKLHAMLYGAMYCQSNGTMWRKTVTSPNTWEEIGGASYDTDDIVTAELELNSIVQDGRYIGNEISLVVVDDEGNVVSG